MTGSFKNQVSKEFASRIDSAGTYEYFGDADPGTPSSRANWRIQRKEVSGTVTIFLWADGNANFDNVWDDRASLSYS